MWFSMHDDRLSEIAFDLNQRYSIARRIATLFSTETEVFRVLDVGGHTPAMWDGFPSMISAVLPGAHTVVADIQPGVGISNYVQTSADALPFGNGSFDLVTCCDTLEHVPAHRRIPCLRELLRVTRDGLYVTFPYDSRPNRGAEKMLMDFLDVYAGSPIPQLQEHADLGLPDLGSVRSFFETEKVAAATFGHGNTDVWLMMMLTFHWLRVTGGEQFVKELNRRFSLRADDDWAEPTYRVCCLVSKKRSPAELEGLVAGLKAQSGRALTADGVLPLCNLVLQTTFQGRILLDKDRHIRHLEAALSQSRRDLNADSRIERKFTELEHQFTEFEHQLQSLRSEVRSLEASFASRLASIAESLTALCNAAELQAQTVARQIDKVQADLYELENRAAADAERRIAERVVKDTERRLADLRANVDANSRQIVEILHSRTWKTLCSAGALVLNARSFATRTVQKFRPERPENIELVLDEPQQNDPSPRSGVIVVRGWALAPSGVDRVEIQVDDAAPQRAEYGLPRPDVALSRRVSNGAARCGFELKLDPLLLPRGPHRVCLTVTSRSGVVRKSEARLVVDRAFASDYDRWIADCEHRDGAAIGAAASAFGHRPLLSLVMPVCNTPPDMLRRAVESVQDQSYTHWELCIADDHSDSAELECLLSELARGDSRIKLTRLGARGGISAASNAALQLATGEFVGLLDHDDELAPDTLFHMVEAINREPDAGLLYSDEDKIDINGRRYEPFFKPDWSPDLLLSENYVCHFLVIRRDLVERAGRFRSEFDGSQDHDLILRVSRLTDRIVHIPRVLYHWRAAPASTAGSAARKPRCAEASRRAVEEHLRQVGIDARVEPGRYPGRLRVRYPIPAGSRVSIIIPSGGNLRVLQTNLDRVAEKTDYPDYEILVVDNSKGVEIERFIRRWRRAGRTAAYLNCRHQPFNWSALNNKAARQSQSPLLLFLNDDTEVITSDWLAAMVELSVRSQVGAVGAKLLYPDGRIQHAGVVMGLFENCGHAFKGLAGDRQHYFDLPDVIRNVSAVTGACLMVRRGVFQEVGGFDEDRFAVAFNDIDLCLRIGARGYRVLYTPHALLYHHEAFSKTTKDLIPDSAEVLEMRSRWKTVIGADPYYSPNLTRTAEDYSLCTC
jgi:GT2 family glycosyltransferase